MAEVNEPKKTKSSSKKVVSRTVCILLVILALICGGLAGYAYGQNNAKDDAQKALQQKVNSLESDLSKAKAAVGSEVQEGQQDIAEGQQTVASLQSENAALKQTISDQQKKITDLEKQLEEAKNSTTN
jgi:peptidoglycan hydrolase CwlO-like protein